MNTVKRFFHRYIFSAVGIVLLFFIVNVLLVSLYIAIAYLNDSTTSNFSIENFSKHILIDGGILTADAQAQDMLNQADAWAMILDDDGEIIWRKHLPKELTRKYTATDIALFSHWYLADYPIKIWKRDDGLLVVGLPPGSVVNWNLSINSQHVRTTTIGLEGALLINILLMMYLSIRNARRVEKAMGPILNGIRLLSSGKAVRLAESGELAEINTCLNKAGEYLLKKDNTRAEWIRGISHDIRTPLSMIMGYASEIEETAILPDATRKQAKIIRRQSEKLSNLVADLNLTTKLEYSMQPMKKQKLDLVELARQVVSEVLNNGLSEQYQLELTEGNPGKNIVIVGDQALLSRMLSNLIRNAMVHNPQGCKIQVCVGGSDTICVFFIMDNGHGVSESLLDALNSDEDISSTQKQTIEAEHGLGLKIVRQIVKAHQGTMRYSESFPHGLTVDICIPRE